MKVEELVGLAQQLASLDTRVLSATLTTRNVFQGAAVVAVLAVPLGLPQRGHLEVLQQDQGPPNMVSCCYRALQWLDHAEKSS